MSQDKLVNITDARASVNDEGIKVKSEVFIPMDELIAVLNHKGYVVSKKNSAVFTVEVKLKDPHIVLSEDHQEQLNEMVKELKATVGDCRFEQDLAARIDVLIYGKSS